MVGYALIFSYTCTLNSMLYILHYFGCALQTNAQPINDTTAASAWCKLHFKIHNLYYSIMNTIDSFFGIWKALIINSLSLEGAATGCYTHPSRYYILYVRTSLLLFVDILNPDPNLLISTLTNAIFYEFRKFISRST